MYRALDGAQGPRAKWGTTFSTGSEAAVYNTVYEGNTQDRKQITISRYREDGENIQEGLGTDNYQQQHLGIEAGSMTVHVCKNP